MAVAPNLSTGTWREAGMGLLGCRFCRLGLVPQEVLLGTWDSIVIGINVGTGTLGRARLKLDHSRALK